MKAITIQQALIEYPYITGRVQALNREISEILSIKYDTSVTARLTGMPGGGQISDPTFQTIEQIVDRLDVHIERIKERIGGLLDAKEMVDNRLDRLNIQERRVVEYRYFQLMQWDAIQGAMHCSETTVYRIHRFAIEAMEDDSKRQDMTVQFEMSV